MEGQVQHCLAITPGLQVEDCWTPLPPEVDSMAELVLDKVVGCCRPKASRPRRHPGSSWSRHVLVLGEGTSPTPQSPSRQSLQPLLKKVIKLVSLVL